MIAENKSEKKFFCCDKLADVETIILDDDMRIDAYVCRVCRKEWGKFIFDTFGKRVEICDLDKIKSKQPEQPEEKPDNTKLSSGIEANELLKTFFASIIVNGGVFSVPKEMLDAIGDDWPKHLKIEEKPCTWEFTVDDSFVLKKSKRKRQPVIFRPKKKKIITGLN